MERNGFFASMVHKLPGSLRGRGLLRTLQYVLFYGTDYLFDLRYNTDTASQVELDDLEVDNPTRKYASIYNGTHVGPLREMFRSLKIDPGKILVDLGCGKGRVLLIASEFGFKEVRGVEFSPVLCAVARNNCSKYKSKAKSNTNFVVIESDVLDYEIEDDEDVFYLFNPFKGYVLRKVLRNMHESYQRSKRKIQIIYCNPVHSDIIEKIMHPVKVRDLVFGDNTACFRIYEIE